MSAAVNRLVGANGHSPAVATVYNFPTAAGAGEGDAVSVSLTFVDQYGNGMLPGDSASGRYSVSVSSSQAACFVSVTSKTASGFTVTLTPTSGTATLAAGTIDVLVHA